jgi:hypothetical protein
MNLEVSRIALRFAVGGEAMKYNINVIKSVWRQLRKTKPLPASS